MLAAWQIPFGLAQHRTSHALSGRGEREPGAGPRSQNGHRCHKPIDVKIPRAKLQHPALLNELADCGERGALSRLTTLKINERFSGTKKVEEKKVEESSEF